MRLLNFAEIETVSGGEDPPRVLPPVTTTVPAPKRTSQPWVYMGISPGEYIFGPEYGSLLIDPPMVLDPIQVQGDPSGMETIDGSAETNSTNSAVFLFDTLGDSLHWYDALFLRDGYFDSNNNEVQDDGEVTFDKGDTALENVEKYNEALKQYHAENPNSYAGDGASPEQSKEFLELYRPFEDDTQYY